MAAISSGFVYFMYTFLEPILAQRLQGFNLTSLQIGAFFTIEPVFYISASLLIRFIPKRIEKRLVIMIAALLTSFGFLLVGPSYILGLPDSLLLIAFGQAITGATTAVMIIPGLSEMIDSQSHLSDQA
jgi:asparagine N-glycosylation enzyme membrane subunit Stt3